jgi:hypothetical protein
MTDDVLLCIGSNKVLMSPEEAFKICEVINGSSRIGTAWHAKGGKDGRGGSLEIVLPPPNDTFIAYVVPMTGLLRMTLDTNEKFLKEESK